MDSFQHWVWSLGHSLWQGAAIGALLWVVLRIVPTTRPRTRYAAALAAMALVLFGIWITWRILERPPTSDPVPATSISATPSETSTPLPPFAPLSTSGNSRSPINGTLTLGFAWATGVALMLLRMMRSLTRARELVRVGRDTDIPFLPRLAQQLGIKRLRALTSDLYRVPAIIGTWTPILLLPASMLAQLPPDQMRLILAHELAHIRRWDYLVNFVQQIVEALLFFNPAVWWISSQIRMEREACCDATAVAICGDGPALAKTLAEVAAALWTGPATSLPQTALAATGSAPGSQVLKRVRRLMGAGDHLLFPLRTFVSGMAVAGLLLAAIGSTAELTVRAAEVILTPAQRVEKVAALQEELGRNTFTTADQPTALLSGTVHLDDGGILPQKATILALCAYRGGTAIAAHQFNVDADGHFAYQAPSGRAVVSISVPGYAPAFAGPIRPRDDGTYPPVDLTLTRGFEAKLQFQNAEGKPVPQGAITLSYLVTLPGATSYRPVEDITRSDDVMTLAHASNHPLEVVVRAEGYQFAAPVVTLEPGKTQMITLLPARPARGVVVDAKTGAGIPGALIQMVRRQGFKDSTENPHASYFKPEIRLTTDANGQFSIDQLRDDCQYAFWVTAPEHGGELVQAVRAGQGGLRWQLGDSRPLTLEIHADPGSMPKTVSVSNGLELSQFVVSNTADIPVEQRGESGFVTVADPLPGEVMFSAGGKGIVYNSEHPKLPLLLELRKGVGAPRATREVIIKLDYPKAGAEPKGKLRVDHIRPQRPNSYYPEWIDVKNGEVHASVPVPTKMAYDQGDLVGFWVSPKYEIEVPAGTEPFVLHVPAEPAGAIVGRFLDDKGEPFEPPFLASVEILKRPPTIAADRPLWIPGVSTNDGSGKFLFSVVPLGGRYRIVVTAGARTVKSEELVVDEAHSIQEVTLRLTP